MAHKFSPGSIPKDIPRWQYDAFRALAAAAGAGNDAISAIGRGEAPDGSGSPLVNLTNYFYLPGRAGGQLGYGDTAASGTLTFSSTSSSTKGKIYLGSALTSVYDELNDRLGVGTAAPSSKFQVTGTTDIITALVKEVGSQTADALEIQNSSGTPLVIVTAAGKIGGGTAASNSLNLISTSNATMGFIYFGSAQTSMFDETNQRIGLNRIPLYRLHQYHSVNEIMQRWEGPASVSVASITANGTTTLTSSAGFGTVFVGMLVFGTGVQANTTVTAWVSSSNITVSLSVTSGTITCTFAHTTDADYIANGSQYDFRLKSSGGIQLVTSSATAGGQTNAIRFVQQTAIGTTIRNFIEAQSANQNIAIAGNNGGDGNSIHTLFTYQLMSNWTGSALSQTARVGLNEDPFDYSGSSGANQPDTLFVHRTVGAAATVSTLSLTGPSGFATTTPALATIASSAGTSPNKTAGAINFFIRHDGQLHWGTTASSMDVTGGTSGTGLLLIRNNNARTMLDIRSKTATLWSDGVAACIFQLTNATDDGSRAVTCGDGQIVLVRYGLSSIYTLITNATDASAGFLAPAATPQVLQISNCASGEGTGADAAIVLQVRSRRTTQTGNMLQITSAVASTIDMTVNARSVMDAGRIKSAVLFTDDNATIASAKLMGFDVSQITAGQTRTLAISDISGQMMVDVNHVFSDDELVAYEDEVVFYP